MPVARPSLTPADAAAFASQRLRRNVGMAFCFIAILLLINWNAKNLSTPSTGLGIGNSKAQASISRKGFVRLPSGATVRTASADQGDNQCISKFSTDTKTAQCQAFCNVKFRKFHCVWCKCRACTFCPKGGEAIEEAAKDAPPPFPPPSPFPPPPPPEAASFTHDDLEPEKPQVSQLLVDLDASSSSSNSSSSGGGSSSSSTIVNEINGTAPPEQNASTDSSTTIPAFAATDVAPADNATSQSAASSPLNLGVQQNASAVKMDALKLVSSGVVPTFAVNNSVTSSQVTTATAETATSMANLTTSEKALSYDSEDDDIEPESDSTLNAAAA